jgi:hypothetical protein
LLLSKLRFQMRSAPAISPISKTNVLRYPKPLFCSTE